jgi:hypothetical protein
VTGVGGTGVVTVGALLTMAAHLEGRQASVLDLLRGAWLLPALRMLAGGRRQRFGRLPERIRGFGHVKLAAVATARAQWRELGERWARGESVPPPDDGNDRAGARTAGAAARGAADAPAGQVVRIVRRPTARREG